MNNLYELTAKELRDKFLSDELSAVEIVNSFYERIEKVEDKIKSWSDFYDIIQKEMDFLGYNEKFRKDDYTYSDIVGDLIVFEKMKEREKWSDE